MASGDTQNVALGDTHTVALGDTVALRGVQTWGYTRRGFR